MDDTIPKTLEECYLILNNIEDLDEWLSCNNEKSALVTVHHTIGRWIRNTWGFWQNEKNELVLWFNDNEIKHPDDMSSIILTSFYRYKKGFDINLEEQLEYYIEYWLDDKQKLKRKREKKLNEIDGKKTMLY
jgi:hypothetical protein